MARFLVIVIKAHSARNKVPEHSLGRVILETETGISYPERTGEGARGISGGNQPDGAEDFFLVDSSQAKRIADIFFCSVVGGETRNLEPVL